MRVALLEEEDTQVQLVRDILSRIPLSEGSVSCIAYRSGERLRRALRHETYDLLIIEWNAPELDGIDLLQWLRNFQKSQVPVMMLTTRTSEHDVARALEAGADDYAVKHVRLVEFSARVARLLRKHAPPSVTSLLVFGDWTFDRANTTVRIARDATERRVELTEREFRLALALFQHLGTPLSRSHLLEYSGVSGDELGSRALDSHMYRLRGKLFLETAHGIRLRTIYGHGYRLELVV